MLTKLSFSNRKTLIIWQSLFLVLGTSWLWAPEINHILTYRTTLISQYEMSHLPYSWIFRICDALSALLLIGVAAYMYSKPKFRGPGIFLLIIGGGMLIDPLYPTTCKLTGDVCREYVSLTSVIHGIETVATALALFAVGIYDIWRRKSTTSIVFVSAQIVYAVLFLSQYASLNKFNTPSQFLYQSMLLVWLAWYIRDLLEIKKHHRETTLIRTTRLIFAGWAFLNGLFAIVVSLAHLQLAGRIEGLYFANDGSWLAEHGVIIGVIMIYLSRHLARGEARARHIFLVIAGLEVIKYSSISPNSWLMIFYLITFVSLFVLKDSFRRGVAVMTFKLRINEALTMIAGLQLAILTALLILLRTDELSEITSRSVDKFFDYTIRNNVIISAETKSALLAHTISAFLLMGLAVVLWILFKPGKILPAGDKDYHKIFNLILKYSTSPEDYFKYWPKDKDYYWPDDIEGFIAYKKSGSVIFVLPDPITPPHAQNQAIESFISWAREHRYTACFLPVYGSGGINKYSNAGLDIMQIGSSALTNIDEFVNKTSRGKWWRWQKNRAEKSGYKFFTSLPPHSNELLDKLKAVSTAWQADGERKERGYAMGYFDKDYLQDCQINYLEDSDGKIIAFSNLLPALNNGKTITIDLLCYMPGINNAMPYLLMKTIGELAENPGVKYFDLGFVPFSKTNNAILRAIKTISAGKFSAGGLEQFKNKFDPEWLPTYMAYDGDYADLAAIASNIERVMERSN